MRAGSVVYRPRGGHLSLGAHAPAMKCYYCENDARGECRFCGSGLCKEHVRAWRFVSGWSEILESSGANYADYVVVENAIWCGRCTVRSFRQGV